VRPVQLARRGLQAILESSETEARLLALAEVGADTARRRCPVGTRPRGRRPHLRDTIKASSEPGRAVYSYGQPHGLLVEKGTVKMRKQPFMLPGVDAMKAALR